MKMNVGTEKWKVFRRLDDTKTSISICVAEHLRAALDGLTSD